MSVMIMQPIEAPTASSPTDSPDQLPNSHEHPNAEQIVELSPEQTQKMTQAEPKNDVVEAEASENIRPSMVLSLVTDEKKAKIYDMHNLIQATIGQIQDKTQQILQDQERDLIRAFRLRLAQVQEDLEKERKKNESGSAEWVVRCHKLTEELEWLRELTDKLTTENNLFIQENQRHARQLAAQDQDRSFMLRQLVAAKKENARLRLVLESLHSGSSGSSARAVGMAKHGSMLSALPYPQLLDAPLPTAHAGVGASTSTAIATASSRSVTARTDTYDTFASPRSGSGNQARLHASEGRTRTTPRPDSSKQRAAALAGARVPASPGPDGEDTLETDSLRAYVAQLEREKEQLAAQLPRMRKALHASEERAKQLHAQVLALTSSRTELTAFFHRAIDDVRADIAARRMERARALTGKDSQDPPRESPPLAALDSSMPPVDPRSIPCSAFSVRDRVHVLEWMLTQDHVVRAIFDAVFPPVAPVMRTATRSHAREALHDRDTLARTLTRIPCTASSPRAETPPSPGRVPASMPLPRARVHKQGAPARAAPARTRTQSSAPAFARDSYSALLRDATLCATRPGPVVHMPMLARSLPAHAPLTARPPGARPYAAHAADTVSPRADTYRDHTRVLRAHTDTSVTVTVPSHSNADLVARCAIGGAGSIASHAWEDKHSRPQDGQGSTLVDRPVGLVARAQCPLWAAQDTCGAAATVVPCTASAAAQPQPLTPEAKEAAEVVALHAQIEADLVTF